MLVYLLDHEYSESGVGRVAALREAAERAGCEAALALAEVHRTWSCFEDDWEDSRFGASLHWERDEDEWDAGDDPPHPTDPDDFTLTDLQDSSLVLDRWLLAGSTEPLTRLHQIAQAAMGWEDAHLDRFEVEEGVYAEHEPNPAFRGHRSAGRARRCDVASAVGDELLYEYDFGDGWLHEIRGEEIMPPDNVLLREESARRRGRSGPEDDPSQTSLF